MVQQYYDGHEGEIPSLKKKKEIAKKMKKKMKVTHSKPMKFEKSTDVSNPKGNKVSFKAYGKNGTPYSDEVWKRWYGHKSNKERWIELQENNEDKE